MNANETEYSIEDDAITCEGNMERGSSQEPYESEISWVYGGDRKNIRGQ